VELGLLLVVFIFGGYGGRAGETNEAGEEEGSSREIHGIC
jgi:hypothetical protein